MKMRTKETVTGIAFSSVFLLGFMAFFIIPFIISVCYTFTFGTGGGEFVGFRNYIDVFKSVAFKTAALNTAKFIGISVPLINVIAMVLSLMLNQRYKSSKFFRSVFLYPLVVPAASVVMVFQIIFAESGLLNTFYSAIGLDVHSWLNSDSAFFVLVLLYIWKNLGYNIVLVLSGLNTIPKDFYEVAKIEGASGWQCFWKITFPVMMPTFFFVVVISIVNAFKSFREAFILGGTMPHKSIYMLQHFMNNNFQNLNYQRLSVAALIVFLLIFILLLLLYKLKQKFGDIQV